MYTARNTENLIGNGNVNNGGSEQLSSNSTSTTPRFDESLIKEVNNLDVTSFDDIGILKEDALKYISGYIIRKLNIEE